MNEFPQYRCYPHKRTWYAVQSATHFLELSVTGKYYTLHEVQALQYPEKLRIADMLACADGHWISVTEEEYFSFLEHCKSHLQFRSFS
jgi:hypothetical protein